MNGNGAKLMLRKNNVLEKVKETGIKKKFSILKKLSHLLKEEDNLDFFLSEYDSFIQDLTYAIRLMFLHDLSEFE